MKSFQDLKRNIRHNSASLKTINIALLGDFATQFLGMAIRGEGVERGYSVEIFEADYNQIERQIFDPSSEINKRDFRYVVVSHSAYKLLDIYNHMDSDRRSSLAEERIQFIRSICENISSRIIYFNYPEVDDMVFGQYANKVEESFTYQLRKLNFHLMELARECDNLFICDIASIQNRYGHGFMLDPAMYVNADTVFSLAVLPVVAARVLDIICAIEGKFNKCLICDLDNTLWGGVVGDDGWENIQIGHGIGIGHVYTEIQYWVKRLSDRGILICVCSKNDEEKAKEPFEKNQNMVLRLDDICIFIANWDNKVNNIQTIQSILNIGYDSMVFLDDNPFERDMVRKNIPGITVPELPETPEQYLDYLNSLNLFETASYSDNDRERTKQYRIEAQRVSSAAQFTNEADYLKSLGMVSDISSFTPFCIPRVAQLSQRSNQFNLRTVRYTEEQLKAVEADPAKMGFAFTLDDTFGSNGLIAAVILVDCEAAPSCIPENIHRKHKALFVDTWFMSCRVLKRGMEQFILNNLVEWARNNNYERIIGEYLQTPKNGIVRDHYPELGFASTKDLSDSQWELELSGYEPKDSYIAIGEALL